MAWRPLHRALIAVTLLVGCAGAGDSTDGGATSVPASTSGDEASTSTSHPSPTAPTSTAAVPGSLTGRVVVLDPGHNGRNGEHPEEIGRLVDIGNGLKACNTTGTVADDGYAEADFNWELALVTRDALEAAGATVVLTREDNDGWGPCITERAAVGNRHDADAVVSLHADGGPAHGRGFHVIHPIALPGLTEDIAAASQRLADALRRIFPSTGMPVADYVAVDGLSARDDLGGLNLSDVPAVFLEVGNMKNPEDLALLRDPAFRRAAAGAITAAVAAFLAGD